MTIEWVKNESMYRADIIDRLFQHRLNYMRNSKDKENPSGCASLNKYRLPGSSPT